MKSYIKIIGPPIVKTIKALEKIAVNMPEVCIMSMPIQATLETPFTNTGFGGLNSAMSINTYFSADMSEERCDKIISKSGESLGEYDFYFEWFQDPSMNDVMMLVEKVDEVVSETGASYTITTK
jgi:hypothetical protein